MGAGGGRSGTAPGARPHGPPDIAGALPGLTPVEVAVVAFVRARLQGATGSVLPLGGVFAALRKVVPIDRLSLAVLERQRELASGRGPGGAGGPWSLYGVGSEDGVADLSATGFAVRPEDDPTLAHVLAGAPALVHVLEPHAAVDRALWLKGIRSTAIAPMRSPGGVVFGSVNVGSTLPDGLGVAHEPFLVAVARELEGPVWRSCITCRW